MKPRYLAIDIIARYLSRRDYSEWELRQRLKEKDYPEEEIAAAIDEAWQRKWLLEPEELSKKISKYLDERGKSYRYIVNHLTNKKLPLTVRDEFRELEKAREIISKKFHWAKPYSFEQKKKVLQYLRNRTYDEPSIRMVINEVE